MELKEIKCQNCGAKLKVNPKDEMVTCDFCKSTFSISDDYSKSYNRVKGALDAQRDSVPKTNKVILYVFLGVFAVIFIGSIVFGIGTMITGGKIFSKVFNEVSSDAKETIDEVVDNESDIIENTINETKDNIYEGFSNALYESYAGTETGISVGWVIDKINTNNKTKEHQITVSYNGNVTSEESQLIQIKDSLDDWTKYEVTFDYNDDGYIYNMNIMNK